MKNEYEIKFTSINRDIVKKKLKEIGFICTQEEFLSRRKTFHPMHSALNEWFRVRSQLGRVTMAYKCIHSNHEISGTEEIEISVNDFEDASNILIKAGLKNTSSQENKREIWNRKEIEICIDTWPGLNPYIEIEGPDEKSVRGIVEEMLLDWSTGLFGGSEVVYERELGISPEVFIKIPNISFDNPPKIGTLEI